MRTFRPLRDLELDAISRLQCSIALSCDIRVVNENVGAAVISSNKTITSRI